MQESFRQHSGSGANNLIIFGEKLGFAVVLISLVLSIAAALGAAYAVGMVPVAQLAERNAKLAQYQTEIALKRAGLEVPNDLTEDKP